MWSHLTYWALQMLGYSEPLMVQFEAQMLMSVEVYQVQAHQGVLQNKVYKLEYTFQLPKKNFQSVANLVEVLRALCHP